MNRKILAAIIISILIYFGYKLITRSKSDAPAYQTSTAAKGTLIVSVTGSGQVSSTNIASVTTKATGRVKRLYVKNGDAIKANQPIAEVEFDPSGQQQASQALASYQSAKANVESAKATQLSLESQMWQANQEFVKKAVDENKTTSEPEYIETNRDWLAAESKYKNQQLALTQAQTALNAAWLSYQQTAPVIYAPISGIITGLSLQEGSILSPSQTSSSTATSTNTKIANLQTNALPMVAINLTEIDVPKVKINDKVTLTFDALPDKTITGVVISIDTVGTTTSGVTSYPATIKLDTQVPNLLPNMSATANIITLVKDDVLLVPTAAVQTQNGQSTVRVLKNNQPESVPVEVGASSDTQTEIISGLAENDTVITGTAFTNSTSGSSTSVFGGFGGGRPMGGTNVRIQR